MSKSTGNFSSVSIGDSVINSFNADGTYNFNGSGVFGIINANRFEAPAFVISANNAQSNILPFGISNNGIGRFTGLNINQLSEISGNLVSSEISGNLVSSEISGNLVFNGDLTQGIIFGDKSFLNTATRINNLTSNKTNFNSINLSGNIIGNNTSSIFNTIDCLNTGVFNTIDSNSITCEIINGNNGQFSSLQIYGNYIIPSVTSNVANINSILGNNINNIQNITFNNKTVQSTAPGTIINGNISSRVNTISNSPLILPAGKWVVSFNINFINATPNNYITIINNVNNNTSYKYSPILLPNTNNSVCSGSYVYQQSSTSTVDFISYFDDNIDPLLSFHTAISIVSLTSDIQNAERATIAYNKVAAEKAIADKIIADKAAADKAAADKAIADKAAADKAAVAKAISDNAAAALASAEQAAANLSSKMNEELSKSRILIDENDKAKENSIRNANNLKPLSSTALSYSTVATPAPELVSKYQSEGEARNAQRLAEVENMKAAAESAQSSVNTKLTTDLNTSRNATQNEIKNKKSLVDSLNSASAAAEANVKMSQDAKTSKTGSGIVLLKQISYDSVNKTICGITVSQDNIMFANSGLPINPVWIKLPGALRNVSIYNHQIYGCNSSNEVYYWHIKFVDSKWTGSWTRVNLTMKNARSNGMKQVSFDGMRQILYGISPDDELWYGWATTDKINITCIWAGSEKIKNISVSRDSIFFINMDNQVFFRKSVLGFTERFNVTGNLPKGLVEVNFDDFRKIVCGVDSDGSLYYADNSIRGMRITEGSPNWIKIPGKFRTATTSGSGLYAANPEGYIVYANDYKNPTWI